MGGATRRGGVGSRCSGGVREGGGSGGWRSDTSEGKKHFYIHRTRCVVDDLRNATNVKMSQELCCRCRWRPIRRSIAKQGFKTLLLFSSGMAAVPPPPLSVYMCVYSLCMCVRNFLLRLFYRVEK